MPAKVHYPGVYVEEAPARPQSIAGVSTSVTAFVGSSRKGSLKKAVQVQSFAGFTERFGPVQRQSELGHAVRQFFLNGGTDAWIARVPRIATVADIKRALRRFDQVDVVNLLLLPGLTAPAFLSAAEAYCKSRRAFLIVDAPASGNTPAAVLMAKQQGKFPSTSNAAVYFPWIRIKDPSTGQSRAAAPSGTIVGLFARIDATRGVWKAPAGNEATLKGVDALEYTLTDGECGMLNPQGINCLRSMAGIGPVAWGARTLAGDDQSGGEWKYVPVRRLALFIEESIYQGIEWVVLEPNGEALWKKLRESIESFLHGLFRQGAFPGRSPREAFFVKCDRTTMTQHDVENGIVTIQVGFAPLKPAEFIVLKFAQRTAGPE
jgi:phage tail sheath protein FI